MCDTPIGDEPIWLDSDYVLKIITEYSTSPVKEIKSFTKAPATAKGEHYYSAMHLLNVEYVTEPDDVTESVSLIVKSRLESEVMSAIEEDINVFQRESQIYNVILKESESLLRSIGDNTVLGPRAIYVDDRVIVQENLKLKGYHIVDVKDGLTFDQITLALEKLAKFHATSMVLYRKNPDMFKYHMAGNVSENPTPLHDVYVNCVQSTVDYCKTNVDLQKYVPKLEEFGAKIIPKIINVFSRNIADRFHVLNHGDLWVNNLMYQGDQDVLFVDFQEGYFGSPGIDWNWFMFSSWPTDVFTNHRDELIGIYHSILHDILHRLDYDQRIPTIEDIKKEIVNKAYHGLSTATCMLPILISEHQELADPMNFILDSEEAIENRRTVFNNPAFGERLTVFLEFLRKNLIV